MTTQNPNMTKLMRKLLSDPRVIDIITQALIDISNLIPQAEKNSGAQRCPPVGKTKKRN